MKWCMVSLHFFTIFTKPLECIKRRWLLIHGNWLVYVERWLLSGNCQLSWQDVNLEKIPFQRWENQQERKGYSESQTMKTANYWWWRRWRHGVRLKVIPVAKRVRNHYAIICLRSLSPHLICSRYTHPYYLRACSKHWESRDTNIKISDLRELHGGREAENRQISKVCILIDGDECQV